MALVVKDRVKETTTTTGTGTITLGGASAGFQTFAVIGNGNTTYYTIVDQATGDWEVGIGTYTASGTTLSRTTVLESSNAGSLVNFAAGSKDVFCTYPAERSVYLDAAGSAVTTLDVGTLGVSTANISNANITAGTVSTTPTNSTDIANKQYVDTISASGVHYHDPVYVEVPATTGNLNATYNNGASGVGATLTNAGTQAAFTADGISVPLNSRVLIYNQTNQAENGVYTLTTVGSGSTNWVLTRATDADTYSPFSPNSLGQGDAFFVTNGLTGAGETYICNTVGTITFGTTAITFAQISDATLYTAGTGLTLTGTEFSITNTAVTAATYGSASSVPVFAVNAQGQITSATNTAIAISAGSVSGLAASATTDTTNASNISSGTLPTGRISGSYTGITGVGTLTAGTWNSSTIGPTYGGTGFTSYTVGDILYADTTSSLAKLSDVAVGNALISGGVSSAPSWGKIGLATHVSGTLPAANGGTGNTSGQAASVANAVTFNTSGGAAAGTTYDGSVARTIDYSTVGAQATLVSGTNIKTINSTSLLGSGNISISPGGSNTQVQYNNSGAFAGSANMTFDGTNFTCGGYISAAGASGFYSTTYVVNSRNPIWRFLNADGYGLSYFQATAGIGGTDTIGMHFGTATAAASQFQFIGNGNFVASGNVTASSDETIKTNWRGLQSDFIEQLAKVKSGTYDRTDVDLTQDGVSAQSLQPVLPNSVIKMEDGKLSVAYGNAAMVSAVELAKRVVEQDKRIATLEALITKLMEDKQEK